MVCEVNSQLQLHLGLELVGSTLLTAKPCTWSEHLYFTWFTARPTAGFPPQLPPSALAGAGRTGSEHVGPTPPALAEAVPSGNAGSRNRYSMGTPFYSPLLVRQHKSVHLGRLKLSSLLRWRGSKPLHALQESLDSRLSVPGRAGEGTWILSHWLVADVEELQTQSCSLLHLVPVKYKIP